MCVFLYPQPVKVTVASLIFLVSNASLSVSSAALEVELSDDSFPPEDFGIVSGMLNVKWERIAPYPPALPF